MKYLRLNASNLGGQTRNFLVFATLYLKNELPY